MKKPTIIQIATVALLAGILLCLIILVIKLDSNSSGNGKNSNNENQIGQKDFQGPPQGGMGGNDQSPVTVTSTKNEDGTYDLNLNNAKWNYDETNDIYYQIGLAYCAKPETTDYETLGIYIPGAYFTGTKNQDGTYTCTINFNGKIGKYSPTTAPVVMPVNTPGYSAQHAPSSYSPNDILDYTKSGFIYVYAGCRGRYNSETEYNSGAPWGVTDLKAAIKFLRYNAMVIPANLDKIFSFGMSGGGAQSAILGASGDSKLYKDYLTSIGAATTDKNGSTISDKVYGSMCWCPITNLDTADAAYEWNMGQYMTTDTRAAGTFTKELSNDLAKIYAEYINKLGLKDSYGNALSLETTDTGIFTSGTYYDCVKSVIEDSLNNYMEDNNLGEEFLNTLNKDDDVWVTYVQNTKKAKITSIEAFVKYQKNATKSVGAFDDLNKSQAENKLFGNKNSTSLHFDEIMSNLLAYNSEKYSALSNWEGSYIQSYSEDLNNTDALGKKVSDRVNMYNPMYFLCSKLGGYGTTNVAKCWRINSGIAQGDTANTTEINLALALQNNPKVMSVDFTTVWGQGHTMAERTGDSTTNFINWINECLQ